MYRVIQSFQILLGWDDRLYHPLQALHTPVADPAKSEPRAMSGIDTKARE